MDRRFRFGWLIGLVGLVLAVLVAVYAYNLGVAHGVAAAAQAAAPAPGVPPFAWGPRPWGFGFFPFFPLFPLFFILLFVVLLRGLFWRGRWGGGMYCRHDGVPAAFDEWHRRAHAQPGAPPASDVRA